MYFEFSIAKQILSKIFEIFEITIVTRFDLECQYSSYCNNIVYDFIGNL